jgi:hypothetical protein
MTNGGGIALEPDYEYATMYLFVPPPGADHAWGLDLTAFEAAVREGFPSGDGSLRDTKGPDQRFAFAATTEDGLTFQGHADVYARDCVALYDGTPTEVARFVVWLRAAVVPEGVGIWFTSRDAVEAGLDEREWQIPDGAGREAVAEALRQHFRDIEQAEAEAARRDGGGAPA